jgi:hypothetical protein
VYGGATGHFKAAIYADNAGSPGSLLAGNNTSANVNPGIWNPISVSAVQVNQGTYYWLALITDVACVAYKGGTGGPIVWRAGETYSSFTFPSTAGTMTGGPYTGYDLIAGWSTGGGSVVAPVVTNIPISAQVEPG